MEKTALGSSDAPKENPRRLRFQPETPKTRGRMELVPPYPKFHPVPHSREFLLAWPQSTTRQRDWDTRAAKIPRGKKGKIGENQPKTEGFVGSPTR